MKYYSEDTVKGLLERMDSHFVKYLENLPSIEIKEPHGRSIDADELLKKVREKADFPSEEWCKAIECIENAPTVLEEEK